ncbi:MAG: class I SAM-dependent methyltransferase [Promethearchaeota archaeon]
MNLEKALGILGKEVGRNANVINKVIETINLKKNAKILDIGTGQGTMAILLALKGYHVITGEPEGDDWADWRTSAKKVGVENLITFRYIDAEKLLFANTEFDAIFVYASFHHIKDKISALKEFCRVVKENGIIIILEFTPEGIEQIRKTFPSHADAVDPRDFAKNLPLKLNILELGKMNAYIFKKS